MTSEKRASEMTLAELVGETGDPGLSLASGGRETMEHAVDLMGLKNSRKTYLEIGCAAGAQTNRVALRHPTVTVLGMDPQPEAIKRAWSGARQWALRNAFYFVEDARAMPFPDGTAHGVMAGNIPVFVPPEDRPKVVAECVRVLDRETGVLVAVPIHHPHGTSPAETVAEVERYIGSTIHSGTEEYWIELYTSEGLRLVARHPRKMRVHTLAEVRAHVERVMASSANDRHSADRRRELGEASYRMHATFQRHNQTSWHSVLAFEWDGVYYQDAGGLYDSDIAGDPALPGR